MPPPLDALSAGSCEADRPNLGLPMLTHDRSTPDEGAADAEIAGPSSDTGGGISSAAEPAGDASDAGTGTDGADGAVDVDAADGPISGRPLTADTEVPGLGVTSAGESADGVGELRVGRGFPPSPSTLFRLCRSGTMMLAPPSLYDRRQLHAD